MKEEGGGEVHDSSFGKVEVKCMTVALGRWR